MAPNPVIMQAVEQLNYRVTVGDVAAQAGLNVNLAQQGLLALASEAGGHLQVAESGEIAYQFPKNFRGVLRNKYFRLRLKEWWEKVWRVLFYLIRISFGILLIVSIVLIFLAIAAIIMASSGSDRNNNDRRSSGGGGGMMFMPRIWFGPDLFWFFSPRSRYRTSYRTSQRTTTRSTGTDENSMNFLEAVFSFLFGDGDPNSDLEERRWQEIGTVIRNHQGAVAAEQIAPYLDNIGSGNQALEDYMLPVLTRFDGRPEVSPQGAIVYHFPELQTTAARQRPRSVSPYLEEHPWRFSHAGSGQIMMSAGLGVVNFVGALFLGNLLTDRAIVAELGGLVAFVNSIYWLLLGYGTAFLLIPLGRYFWIQWRNRRIAARNEQRRTQALQLSRADTTLQHKLAYAQQFAAETVISQSNLAYTTETDLVDQEAQQADKIDAEWRRRLDQSSGS